MAKYVLLFLSLLFVTFNGYTVDKVPRSLEERLDGVGYIDRTTQAPVQFQDQDVVLQSPHADPANPEALTDSAFRRDEWGTGHKRSIVLLDRSGVDSLSNKELRQAIYATVGVKGSGISTKKWKLFRETVKNRTKFSATGFENFHIIGNFVHHIDASAEQSFFVAIVPKTATVSNLLLQMEWFGDGAGGHSQIRFILDQNFIAIPQVADQYSPFVISNKDGKGDFVYSLQALRVNGGITKWSPIEGLMGEYANALQFFSTPSKAKRQIFDSYVAQYEITSLTPKQKQSILEAALVRSNTLEDSTIYNTVFNSCITHALYALRGLPSAGKPGQYYGMSGVDPAWFNPYTVVQRVKGTGAVLEQGVKFPESTNKEFLSSFTSPEGKTVLSYADIQATESYKTLKPLTSTILSLDSTEDLIRAIAFDLIQSQLTLAEVEEAIASIQKLIASKDLSEAKLTKTQLVLYKLIKDRLQEYSPKIAAESGKKVSAEMTDVLTVLSMLQTQHVGEL